MKRTERIARVIQRQGVESVVIPPAFHLEATAVVVRQEGERLVLIPLAGPEAPSYGHAPRPRPNLTTAEEARRAVAASKATFEVIGGPYPRFGSWSGRLQRLWAWATPSFVHERTRDRAWHAGFEAGRCIGAEPTAEPPAPFPWLERFKARLATGAPMPSPDRPEGERVALELLELRKGD